ncbi:MAG: PVC-type heme-binding CxxCH protein [Planctomycetota bacterium]
MLKANKISVLTATVFVAMWPFHVYSLLPETLQQDDGATPALEIVPVLRAELDGSGDKILVYQGENQEPSLTQIARPGFRPYVHPITTPDGNGVLTQFSPDHHQHQTGLYWGYTRLNGRDYFHNPDNSHWRRVNVQVVTAEAATAGDSVQWQTVYDLLDEAGTPVLRETLFWSMAADGDVFELDLTWSGEAMTDVELDEYDYGGLFLRMPWAPEIEASATNSARQKNERAEGQRAVWLDVGMEIEGREDHGRIAIFDHPENEGFPHPWRVDGQLGVGPARSRLGNWQILEGDKEVIRHQLIVSTGELNDVELTNRWSKFSGKEMPSVQWGQARQEGYEAEFLGPQQAVDAMTLKPGFAANVFAAEPMITQPMAFCWDSKGRLWIAENRDYESRGDGFSNSGDSRILILEDTDHDGVADSRKVFAEGIPFPAGIAVGMGGLWLGAPPNLLFIPDKDGDDIADMNDIEVRLTGWGIRDRHETLNSFHWGPDGWLYGCQGFATPSTVGIPRGEGRLFEKGDPFPDQFEFANEPVQINGGVWRYHPIKRRFEVVAHGFSNPWGIDYNARGQLFITACVIPHLWHVIPGGIYHRQGGSHFNPHVYSDIRTIADHRHRSAHGGARVYLSDGLPDEYYSRIFMANIHEHAVLTDILEPSGSGYIGREGDEFALANNAQWIGFSVEIGPDGAVYVLDWHDADICGTDVLNKDTGRVFRFAPVDFELPDFEHRYSDLTSLDDVELARLQLHKSAWHARRARLILQHRSQERELADGAISALMSTLTYGETDHRLRALWALHITGSLDEDLLPRLLGDKDPWLRAWSVQLLTEDRDSSDDVHERFVSMSRSDDSPVVRLYLAAALQRISDVDTRWSIIDELVQHQDAEDHNLDKMIWFGLEPLVVDDPDRALKVAATTKIPVLARFIARRLVSDDRFDPLIAAVDSNPENQLEILLGMRDGLEGRYDVEIPETWSAAYLNLQQAGGEEARVALQLSQQFGDAIAAETMLVTLLNENADIADRRAALKSLELRKDAGLGAELISLLDDNNLRRDVIRAMAAFDEESLAVELLARYDQFDEWEKLDVVHTLSARSASGWLLTVAIKDGRIPRSDVPAYVARILQRVVGNGFVEVWGPVEQVGTEREAQIQHVRQLLVAEQEVDLSHGRVLFNKTCASCHKLHGYGRDIGPDITGANRESTEYLLGNIMTPSAEIQDDYRMSIILMEDGRVYSGVVSGEDERLVRLMVADDPEPVLLPVSAIESRKLSTSSMMPDGLLNNLSDQEVVDLIGYLKNPGQVELPGR